MPFKDFFYFSVNTARIASFKAARFPIPKAREGAGQG